MSYNLAAELEGDFRVQPLEAGYNHRAEETLERYLRTNPGAESLANVRRICLNADRPATAAGTLTCLAALDRKPETPEWRAELVREALASPSAEMRDAAIGATEHWGYETATIEVLRQHQDPDRWLQEYAEAVIADGGQR